MSNRLIECHLSTNAHRFMWKLESLIVWLSKLQNIVYVIYFVVENLTDDKKTDNLDTY